MKYQSTTTSTNRRSFLKQGAFVAGAVTAGAAAAAAGAFPVYGEEKSGRLTPGDAAILRFLAAAELIETDLWLQYTELGGIASTEVPGAKGGNSAFVDALSILDGDMPQYITDNTDDEMSHHQFLNAYLASKGADTVDLSPFATIPGSTASGSTGKKRITNLTELNIDTSFWSIYRIDSQNPDLGAFTFPQAVDIKNRTAIPRSDADTAGSTPGNPSDHLKAIAFTAGFHFAAVEAGGTSLYAQLAQRVSNPEALRVVLSIGPTEAMHFQTWQDKAGNATPVHDVDPITGAPITFVDLKTGQPESLQANLIMPEPTVFLSRKFPKCSIVRPTETKGAAVKFVHALVAAGLFNGQKNPAFFALLQDLAEDADDARRDL